VKIIFSQTIVRHLFALGAVAFLFMSFLGLSHAVMDRHGEMMNCPFMNTGVLCQMTPFQHLSAWQSMFTQVSLKEILNTSTLVLLSFLLAVLLRSLWHRYKFPLRRNLGLGSRTISIFIPDLLTEAFSAGILNPKLF